MSSDLQGLLPNDIMIYGSVAYMSFLVQGDPWEPDIFKINSTQLFFK